MKSEYDDKGVNLLEQPLKRTEDGVSLSASNPSLNGEPGEPSGTSLIMHNNNSSAWRARNAAEE